MICVFKTIHCKLMYSDFKDMRFKIYELDPTCFLTAPGLAWQVAKKTKVRLNLLTDINV